MLEFLPPNGLIKSGTRESEMSKKGKEKNQPYNVYFISDLHIGHKNILKHSPKRIEVMELVDEDDVEGHDRWIVEMWNNTVQRGDHVYVLGDFIMTNRNSAVRILHNLKKKGCHIHLIVGNHDKSTYKLDNMFESIDLIKVVDFKKTIFPFLDEDFTCVMCHYPMKSWPRKCHGSVNLFGHIHDNSPWVDTETDDLCLNVGLDTPLSSYQLISLKEVYDWYKNKLNGLSPTEYIKKVTKENSKFIR